MCRLNTQHVRGRRIYKHKPVLAYKVMRWDPVSSSFESLYFRAAQVRYSLGRRYRAEGVRTYSLEGFHAYKYLADARRIARRCPWKILRVALYGRVISHWGKKSVWKADGYRAEYMRLLKVVGKR